MEKQPINKVSTPEKSSGKFCHRSFTGTLVRGYVTKFKIQKFYMVIKHSYGTGNIPRSWHNCRKKLRVDIFTCSIYMLNTSLI